VELTTFFCDVLEHLLVQEQLGDQPLEPFGFQLQLTATTIGVRFLGVVSSPPSVVRVLSNAQLSTDISNRQTFGQIAVGFTQHAGDLGSVPSLSHGSLRRLRLPGD
jgi:hypothetical protein